MKHNEQDVYKRQLELFADLDRIIQGYLPVDKIELIKRAFVIARDAHEGQFRSSGEPYITHPVAVASIIAELNLDHEAIMAALLHDVIEDTPVSYTHLPLIGFYRVKPRLDRLAYVMNFVLNLPLWNK